MKKAYSGIEYRKVHELWETMKNREAMKTVNANILWGINGMPNENEILK